MVRATQPRLFEDRRGNVAVVTALSSVLFVGGAGLAIDVGYWQFSRLRLQNVADAASYDAALARRSGAPRAAVEAAGLASAEENGFDAANGAIQINMPPQSGAFRDPRSVEVVLTETQPRFFSGLFSNEPVVLRARSVATFQTAENACMLALNPTASAAISFGGNTTVALKGCGVMANSVANDAINMHGSARVTTTCFVSAGGVTTTNGVTFTECPAPILQAPPVADPYADVPVPTASGPCRNGNGATLQPGRYCSGLTLQGTVNLQPGVYVISGGDFRINANANVTGSGVTFVLQGGARVQMNGAATFNLSAPTTGAHAGILFFGDRDGAGGVNRFNGTAQSRLTGSIYMPTQGVEYRGDFSGLNGCTQIVADTIDWSGSADIAVDCSAQGVRPLPVYHLVRVVE